MPVYNAERYLSQAVDSVLNQTYAHFELLLINDGSTDSSKEIILSYNDSRIRYIENEQNIGIVNTLNKGVKLCNGEYIVRMDADDICNPTRFERQQAFMREHPEVGVCGSWITLIDEDNKVTGGNLSQIKSEFIKIHQLFSVPFNHPSVIAKSELLKQNPYEHVIAAEDYDLWCRLEEQTEFANIPEFLLQYRWHQTNVSKEKTVIQQESKDRVILKQMKKLGLTPSEEEFRIHKLSFSLYSFDGKTENLLSKNDLHKTALWFKKLTAADRKVKRYKKSYFSAFLWARWIMLCVLLRQKHKIFFPSFASYNLRTVGLLFQQLLLLSKKRKLTSNK
jgi:glycosyltransferase involved in cell wall biosynthesis